MKAPPTQRILILVFHTLGFLKWPLGVLWVQNMAHWIHTIILLFLGQLLAYKRMPWACLLEEEF